MDKIKINQITAYGYHGALPEERVLGQKFRVNLEISLDTQEAGRTDDLEKTLDYGPVIQEVVKILTGPSVKLVETLAETIAKTLLSLYAPIHEIQVEVEKPTPPVAADFSGISVCIRRSRH